VDGDDPEPPWDGEPPYPPPVDGDDPAPPCDGEGSAGPLEPPWDGDVPLEPPCEGTGVMPPPCPPIPGNMCGSTPGTQSGFFTSSPAATACPRIKLAVIVTSACIPS